ncbi:hypothetical protein L798_06695 [Zootermopsis nevadensis]|uniref:Uncharacterized protein n=1 Tax=Zootermopsis nevadensis TaxID=136037 RepID=A0A067R905_ZOONE|nr:hypothetical protein L798_06695 [Zootermopsis nevadensis]
MKELIELQGHFNAEKNSDPVDSEYSSTRTKFPPTTKTNCSSISVTVSAPCRTQQSKSSKQCAESSAPLLGRRPSTGSTDAAKMSYGFQDEFQKHLFQETMNKQDPEVPNSYKMARSKAPVAHSQANHTTVHSSITNRHNQNSSLEGCAPGPNSRHCSNPNSAAHYPKVMSVCKRMQSISSVNMESYTGPPYLSRMSTSLNSILQDITSNAHTPQSGTSQHSPPY